MRRFWLLLSGLLALIGMTAGPVSAQSVDSAFSDTIIKTLGYPEVQVEVSPDGVKAPATLAEGYYLFTLSATGDSLAYLDVVQPSAGLSPDEELRLMLDAGRNDLAQPDWVYAGGTNTPNPGETASFVIYLAAGDYKIAASYYATAQGSEEIMKLLPLTVTAATPEAASPAANAEPPATVTLEETDELRYLVSPDPVPAGPQIWKIANTGMHHAHHVVMMRIPDGVTADQIVAEFKGLMSGTPAAEPPLYAQFVWVAYAALQSGGQTTWAEFDLTPGTYATICFIIDPATGQPHALNGMVTVFTVV
ncbi:MAG TPA: hypothetical protein VKB09_13240 [Thermomicrobiales bacterium]|nr:hypothetical protein [Thermomicrobiales bacterium]